MKDCVLVVIPARGGSKGIPRKNLRPLAGKPLLYYSIQAALSSKNVNNVVVTTDDDEIALFAERFGAAVIKRPQHLASDEVTIDPVVIHAVDETEKLTGYKYNAIVTVQPTSPLISAYDIEQVVRLILCNDTDTVISVVEDKHLRWKRIDGVIVPEYEKRVNRQQLPDIYRETGAIIACKKTVLGTGSRIGRKVALHVIKQEMSVDIDTYNDLMLCENIINRKKIIINVIGSRQCGLGHAYRSVMIANELVRHDISFICSEEDELAYDYITKHNYSVMECPKNQISETILSLKPDMVINDILDTTADYIVAFRKEGIKVVNFEDMGYGAEVADLVVNALYPHQIPSDHILVGPKYFCLRDEFLHAPLKDVNEYMQRVFISFGGVDEGDLTGRILRLIGKELSDMGVRIDVILGPGYIFEDRLRSMIKRSGWSSVDIIKATSRISDYISKADIAITSAGRTVLEIAAVGVPMIVICQNHREASHKFATSENGVINLGLRHELEDEKIISAVRRLVNDVELRKTMHNMLKKINLRTGKKRVIEKITSLLQL